MALIQKFYETEHLSFEITGRKNKRKFAFSSKVEGYDFFISVNLEDSTASLFFAEESQSLLSEAVVIFREFMQDNDLGVKAIEHKKSRLNKYSISKFFFREDRKKYLRCTSQNDDRLFLITDEEYQDFVKAGIYTRLISIEEKMPVVINEPRDIQATSKDLVDELNYLGNPERFKNTNLFVCSRARKRLKIIFSDDTSKPNIFPKIKTDDGKGDVELFFIFGKVKKNTSYIDFSNIGDEVNKIGVRIFGDNDIKAEIIRKSLETIKNKNILIADTMYSDILSVIDYEKYSIFNDDDNLNKVSDLERITVSDLIKEFERVNKIGIDVMKKRNHKASVAKMERTLAKIKSMNLR